MKKIILLASMALACGSALQAQTSPETVMSWWPALPTEAEMIRFQAETAHEQTLTQPELFNDFAAKLGNLLSTILRHVARTGDDNSFAFIAVVPQMLEGFRREIAEAIACCLRAGKRTTESETFSGQNAAFKAINNTFVLTVHIRDLTCADSDISRGSVRELADVPVEFRHKTLTETHDLSIGFTLRIKVAAAFAAAHRERGQAVLDGLLEGEKLHDAEVDAGMEAYATFVGADGAVHLDTETAVDLDLAAVVHPGDTENDHALGLDDTLHDLVFDQMGVRLQVGRHAGQYLPDGLVEFKLSGVLRDQVGHERLDVLLGKLFHKKQVLH